MLRRRELGSLDLNLYLYLKQNLYFWLDQAELCLFSSSKSTFSATIGTGVEIGVGVGFEKTNKKNVVKNIPHIVNLMMRIIVFFLAIGQAQHVDCCVEENLEGRAWNKNEAKRNDT